jgi:hypothetical protein
MNWYSNLLGTDKSKKSTTKLKDINYSSRLLSPEDKSANTRLNLFGASADINSYIDIPVNASLDARQSTQWDWNTNAQQYQFSPVDARQFAFITNSSGASVSKKDTVSPSATSKLDMSGNLEPSQSAPLTAKVTPDINLGGLGGGLLIPLAAIAVIGGGGYLLLKKKNGKKGVKQ